MWSAVYLAHVLGPSEVLELRLVGPDDYMRFVQVFRWIDGASWFDLSEPRINPPRGIVTHWTRLADIPLAAVITLVEPWAGREAAAITAAIVVPALLFYVTLLALGWLAYPLMGQGQINLTIFIGILSYPLVIQFLPGRVDHHQWILMTTAVSLGALARMMIRPEAIKPPLVAATAMALGLWVVGAMIPWLIAFNMSLLLHWIRTGDRSVRAGLIFSAVFLVLSALILVASKPVSDWMIIAWDSFSIVSVCIAGMVFLFWGGLWLSAGRLASIPYRLVAAGGLGAVLVGGVILIFSDYLDSPYGKIDPYLMRHWLANVNEYKSILTIFAENPFFFPGWVGAPLVALIISLICSLRVDGRKRSLWLMFFIFLAAGVLLSLWQKRFSSAAHLFSIVPITWLLGVQWRRLEQSSLPEVGRFIGKYIMVFVFGMGFWFFTALGPNQPSASNCDTRIVAEAIPKQAANSPKLIAAVFNASSEILFRTPHAVLAAPIINNEGNLDLFALLRATSADVAHTVVERRGIDYILICPSSGEARIYEGDDFQSFHDRLAAGEIPTWLAPIKLSDETDHRLFEVVAP